MDGLDRKGYIARALQGLSDAEANYSSARLELDEAKREIGVVLRKLRQTKSMTLKEVADGIIAPPTLYDVELGRRFLSQEKLQAVLNVLEA